MSNTPITDAVYGPKPSFKGNGQKPPTRGTQIYQLLDEATLAKLSRRWPRLRKYQP